MEMKLKVVYECKNVPKLLEGIAEKFHMMAHNSMCEYVNPRLEKWNNEYEFEFGKNFDSVDHYNRWMAARYEEFVRQMNGPFMTFTVDPVDVVLVGHIVGIEDSSIRYHLEEIK